MSISRTRIRNVVGVLALVALLAAPATVSADPAGVRWDTKINVATGTAHKGPWRMNRSKFLFVDDPTVAITEQGAVGVAWANQTKLDIFFQAYGPNGKTRLDAPVNVSVSPATFSWLPRLVIDPNDDRRIFVLWQEIVFSGGSHGGEIFFARSTDGGKTFDRPVNLSKSTEGDGKGRLTERYWDNGSLDLFLNAEGTLIAAWTEYDGRLWVSRSLDQGRSFSRPILVAGKPDESPARGPSLAGAADGTVYLAWTAGEDAAANIHIAASTDGGRSFGAPRTAIDSGGHADAPKIAVDRAGTIHLVYGESAEGMFGRYRVLYTRSKDGARRFEAPRYISNPLAQQFPSMSYPSLAIDGANNIYVLWEVFLRPRHYSLGLALTLSRNGGESFAPPAVVPGTVDPALGINGSQQGLLMRKLAVNKAGAVAVVNSTFKAGDASHVWLFRGKANLR
ncbi:MAG: glycoside hydrolase [Alphaproteobacteria bacterium]|nr:glycoside hydrolase [Alphaproteobacteria bacterium]